MVWLQVRLAQAVLSEGGMPSARMLPAPIPNPYTTSNPPLLLISGGSIDRLYPPQFDFPDRLPVLC